MTKSVEPKFVEHWALENNKLTRTVEPDTYVKALALLLTVGEFSETHDHHPDMHLHYKKLTIEFWTHTANGVTDKDFECANNLNPVISKFLA